MRKFNKYDIARRKTESGVVVGEPVMIMDRMADGCYSGFGLVTKNEYLIKAGKLEKTSLSKIIVSRKEFQMLNSTSCITFYHKPTVVYNKAFLNNPEFITFIDRESSLRVTYALCSVERVISSKDKLPMIKLTFSYKL